MLPITSFSEKRLIQQVASDSPTDQGVGTREMQRLTAQQMIRVYPRNTRFDSANLDPLPCWRAGAQLVALNFQRPQTTPMQLNTALFRA